MYHVELRQFPHNFCRFNLTERELRETILDAWARGEWIELGERKWSPHQANLTVLDGPRLPVEQLSMGRGWRNAQRQGQDVTERVLAGAHVGPTADPEPDVRLQSDSLGLEVLAKLAMEPVPPATVWRLARERHPERPASHCLELAELAICSLAEARLAVVLAANDTGEYEPCGSRGEVEQSLRAIDSWAKTGNSAPVLLRRA